MERSTESRSQQSKSWHATVRWLSFATVAAAVFVLAFILETTIRVQNLDRHSRPAEGSYYGSIRGSIEHFGKDLSFYFRFTGESKPQWISTPITNFTYQTLALHWDSGISPKHANAILELPSFRMNRNGSIEVLDTNQLSRLLLGDRGDPTAERNIRGIYRMLESAGNGTLPPPRHHIYYWSPGDDHSIPSRQRSFFQPKDNLIVTLQHSSLGARHFRFGQYALVACLILTIAAAVYCQRRWRSQSTMRPES